MLDLLTNDSATQALELHRIRLDGGTQPRGGLDNNHLDDLRQATRNGLQLPPVSVVYDGQNYWLYDGFHRVHIATQDGQTRIMATIRPGTLAEAQWLSYAANQSHGLKRSTADKERAIKAALRHEMAPGLSDRRIADHLGVSDKTIAKYRAELVAGAEIPHLPTRTGIDGRAYPAQPARPGVVQSITTDDRRALTEDETTAVIWRVVKYNVPMHPSVAGLEKWAAYKKYLEHNAHVRNYLSALADGVKLDPGTFHACLAVILNELTQNIHLAQRATEQPRLVKRDPGYRQTDLNEAIAAAVGPAAAGDQALLNDGVVMAPPAVPAARFTAAMALDGWELRQVVATGQWWAYNAQHKRSTATYADPNDAISAAYDKQFDKAPRPEGTRTESAPDAKRMLDLVWELLDGCMAYYGETIWFNDETTAHERLAEIEVECGFGVTLAGAPWARLEEE